MESKIEKMDYILIEGYDALKRERKGDVDYNCLAEKINEIIDYLNSQDQEEEEEKYKKGDRVKLALADKEGWIAGEFEIAEKTNLDWKDGDIMNTVDKEGKLHHFVLRDMMPEDTPEEWEKELSKLTTK